jgi:glycosyltransferase involved in cell wall biosynthesis
MFLQFIFLATKGWKYKMFFIWFADYHSLLPILFAKLFRQKSLLVIGGYDVIRMKTLNYGAFCKKGRGFFTIHSMKQATINLTVSNFVDRKVKYIAPKARRELIYNAINFRNTNENQVEKEKIALTVGMIKDNTVFLRKGIDTFIETARRLPEYNFYVIGANKELFDNIYGTNLPDNLHVIGFTDHDKLTEFYQRSKIYIQLSRMDTFCLAIAEAMYFDCVPIITNEGGMPEVTGKFGVKTNHDPDMIAQTVEKWMKIENPPKSRDYIISKFDMRVREKNLLRIIKEIHGE